MFAQGGWFEANEAWYQRSISLVKKNQDKDGMMNVSRFPCLPILPHGDPAIS